MVSPSLQNFVNTDLDKKNPVQKRIIQQGPILFSPQTLEGKTIFLLNSGKFKLRNPLKKFEDVSYMIDYSMGVQSGETFVEYAKKRASIHLVPEVANYNLYGIEMRGEVYKLMTDQREDISKKMLEERIIPKKDFLLAKYAIDKEIYKKLRKNTPGAFPIKVTGKNGEKFMAYPPELLSYNVSNQINIDYGKIVNQVKEFKSRINARRGK